jgi:hypothetical protein
LCVIQDMCLADIYKGREAFSEIHLYKIALECDQASARLPPSRLGHR